MNKRYVGITLGPIQNTLELSNSPAGLWASSYLFSKMAKEICQELLNSGIQLKSFITPYFELDPESAAIRLPKIEGADLMHLMKRGVGFFHDRIIYQADQSDQKEIVRTQKCIDQVLSRICESILNQLEVELSSLEHEKQNLYRYFQIYTVCMEVKEADSPILTIGSALDHLENECSFWTSTKRDYLWEILSDNEKVKNSWMTEDLLDWQLIQDRLKNHIMNIPHLAQQTHAPTEEKLKKHAYFALVQADGDCMGAVLGSLTEVEDIRQFSKKCLAYTAKCAKRILEYGGIVIYAGGDDLLFLAPVESYKVWNDETGAKAEKKNILELLEELKTIFLSVDFERGGEQDDRPSLSMGMSIQYHKYPLYESLKNGTDLLFETAKQDNKDSLAVQLIKHSGKGAEFVIHSFSKTTLIKDIVQIASGEKSADALSTVLRHVAAYKAIFGQAIQSKQKNTIENVFTNLLLDNPREKERPAASDLTYLVDLLLALINQEGNLGSIEKEYTSILRYMKFFSEEREGEETDEDY